MKVTRKIIHIDEELCDGCGACVPSCAEGAIEVVDGKAKIASEKYCDGLGACLGECPKGALRIEEREAEEFDEEAVETHLSSREAQEAAEKVSFPQVHGCPSQAIQSFAPTMSERKEGDLSRQTSALSHWPVQIRLVPPTAPFLKKAHLLIAADCVPVAYPNFHQDFLKGKAVMVGCPKFDDTKVYIDKFKDIFSIANIQSVTVVEMEVPCCSALPVIVRKGMEAAGKQMPMEEIVVSARGEILKRNRQAA